MSPFKLNNSMFMRPLCLPPSAWTGHIPFAAWIIEELRPQALIELGTHNGASYLAFCQAVQQNACDTKCFAVDTWQGDEHAGNYGEDVYRQLYDYHHERYGAFSQLLRMTFDEAAGYFADGSVDLLHIDGLHTYEAVRHDFETWQPKLSDRAVVLFHDTMVRERNFGVWKLWSEIADSHPSFEFQHGHGLGVLLFGKQQPASLRALANARGSVESTQLLKLFASLAAEIQQAGQLQQARQRAEAAEASLPALQQQLAALNMRLGGADAHALHQKARVEHLAQQLATSERTGVESRAKLADCEAAVAALQNEIAQLQAKFGNAGARAGSRVWRWTAPVRGLLAPARKPGRP